LARLLHFNVVDKPCLEQWKKHSLNPSILIVSVAFVSVVVFYAFTHFLRSHVRAL